MKQLIIARKDLNMSAGKLAAQVSHGSMAYFMYLIKSNITDVYDYKYNTMHETTFIIDNDIYDNWINGIYTKIICEAKNCNQLLKAKTIAEDLGLVENEDFFLIKDVCLTELTPEEYDENGEGRVLTCIGFKPLPDDIVSQISKKYQLYR